MNVGDTVNLRTWTGKGYARHAVRVVAFHFDLAHKGVEVGVKVEHLNGNGTPSGRTIVVNRARLEPLA